MCGHGGRRDRKTVPSAGFGKAGQAQWDGGGLGVGCGGEAEKPEVFSVGGPNDQPLAVGLSGVEGFEDLVAVLGDDARLEEHHWAEVEAALVDGEGELLAHAADGTWPAGQEGSQGGGVLAVQGAADAGQEPGDRAVSSGDFVPALE